MLEKIKAFHRDDSGDIVQTGIIIGLFAAIAVAAIVFLRPIIGDMFNSIGGELDKAGTEMGGTKYN